MRGDVEKTEKQNGDAAGQSVLDRIDAALIGLAHMRARVGVYEYIPAARLSTNLSRAILSPTLCVMPAVPMPPTMARQIEALNASLRRAGAVTEADG